MSSLVVQTAPIAEPLPLSVIKSHVRVTIDADDELLRVYALAARELGESDSGRSFVNKGYVQSHDRFPSLHDWGDFGTGYFYQTRRYSHGHERDHDHRQEIKLLRCPLVSVEQITYIGTDGLSHDLFPAPPLWQPSTVYAVGDEVQDANGNLQTITAVDDSKANRDGTFSSGSAVPSWGASLNATAADGPFTWTCTKIPAYAGDFLVDANSEPPRIMPVYGQAWPLTQRIENAVQIFFTAGYGNSGASVPACGKVFMLQLIANWYRNREPATSENLKKIPLHFDDLLWNIRVLDWAPTR